MKKFATLSLAAAAALTLSACGGGTDTNNVTTIDNEVVLNSEEAPFDNLAVEDPALTSNVGDNFTVDSANTSFDLNSTTTNTVE